MAPPIPLRAHNLLCLLGYRGKGYDARFVAEMTAVSEALRADRETRLEIRTSPDRLCAVCPNLGPVGCRLGGSDHEAHMHAQDEDVARRLGLRGGDVVTWAEVLRRVATSVRGTNLPAICTTCPWLSLGWCAEGIDALRGVP